MVPRAEMLAGTIWLYQFGGGAFRDLEIELHSLAVLVFLGIWHHVHSGRNDHRAFRGKDFLIGRF